ncbi:MAG TPA: hypothetical protein VIA62_22370 [Thermoanaerobaculia bacterium]|jgi:hypothetical protein|nr:hypothetical protein [Thermoanaerobaculia bacterium]
MRRKLLMLVTPVVLLLASFAVPAFAIPRCSCNYCAQVGPDQICNDPTTGSSTFCVNFQTAHCP